MLKDVEIRSKNITCFLLQVFKSIVFCFQKSYSKSRPEKKKGIKGLSLNKLIQQNLYIWFSKYFEVSFK